MAKLTLQFEGRGLKAFVVEQGVTIGRLPDNAVVIDNPAVSGHHARIVRDGERLVLEDLQSTNGTFVNDEHVYRHILRHGDVVLVGKHHLVYESGHAADDCAAEPALAPLGDTMYLDTKRHRALLASLRAARAEADLAAGVVPTVSVPPMTNGIGVLRVLSGDADRHEYELGSQTCLIGKASTALVRLRGWFKPEVAAAIARNRDGYVMTRFGGRTLVNSVPVRGQHHLKDGDVLSVGGLTLEFRVRADGDHPMPLMSVGQRTATGRSLT